MSISNLICFKKINERNDESIKEILKLQNCIYESIDELIDLHQESNNVKNSIEIDTHIETLQAISKENQKIHYDCCIVSNEIKTISKQRILFTNHDNNYLMELFSLSLLFDTRIKNLKLTYDRLKLQIEFTLIRKNKTKTKYNL
ncbi:MAG: hypothetical protein L6Q33_03345 [Bacteriovoracaceae bacterium]|nr:hypothetical protein [Bacteriovoracaceae bacterium]